MVVDVCYCDERDTLQVAVLVAVPDQIVVLMECTCCYCHNTHHRRSQIDGDDDDDDDDDNDEC